MIRHLLFIESAETNQPELDNFDGYQIAIGQLPYALHAGDVILLTDELLADSEVFCDEPGFQKHLLNGMLGTVRKSVLAKHAGIFTVTVYINITKEI